jgi:hypothetical protein
MFTCLFVRICMWHVPTRSWSSWELRNSVHTLVQFYTLVQFSVSDGLLSCARKTGIWDWPTSKSSQTVTSGGHTSWRRAGAGVLVSFQTTYRNFTAVTQCVKFSLSGTEGCVPIHGCDRELPITLLSPHWTKCPNHHQASSDFHWNYIEGHVSKVHDNEGHGSEGHGYERHTRRSIGSCLRVFQGHPRYVTSTTDSICQTWFGRDDSRFGQTETDFGVRFGLTVDRLFGSETETEKGGPLTGGVRRTNHIFFFLEIQHTVLNGTRTEKLFLISQVNST